MSNVVSKLTGLVQDVRFGLRQLRKPISQNDALSLETAIFAMTSAALFAGYLPARRAARVDPMVALGYE